MERLIESITNGHALLIIGTGVSKATSNGATATWIELIQSGLDLVEKSGAAPKSQVENFRRMLADAAKSDDVDTFLLVSEWVKGKLGKHNRDAYAEWLEQTVGALTPSSPDLIQALLDLKIPILTTNYDTLIEQVSGKKSVTWQEPAKLAALVKDTRGGLEVGHLHGVWDQPDTVILSTSDYYRLNSEENYQAVQRALGIVSTVIFVGMGSGVDDPNLGGLLDWLERTLPGVGCAHYRLCRDADIDAEDSQPRAWLQNVSYGEKYSDLVPFVRRMVERVAALRKPGLMPVGEVAKVGRDFLEESIARDSVEFIGSDSVTPVSRKISLPILSEVGASSTGADIATVGSEKWKRRIDPENLIETNDAIVVVGASGSGITTTAKWLAMRFSDSLEEAIPIYLRLDDIKSGKRPFRSAWTQAAIEAGMSQYAKVPDTEYILVVDDFYGTMSSKKVRWLLEGISETPPLILILGCSYVNEANAREFMYAYEMNPRVVHLGYLSYSDIREVAESYGIEDPRSCSKAVFKLLQSQNIPRTPMNVRFAFSVILQGGKKEIVSATTLMSNYFSYLFSNRVPQDFELALTVDELIALLGNVAIIMTEQNENKMTESQIIYSFAQTFLSYGWDPVSGADVLRLLCDLNVMREEQGSFHFTRLSYLYYFAAKAAVENEAFRTRILADPVFYQPIVSDYAALMPSDTSLLQRIISIMTAFAPLLEGSHNHCTPAVPLEISATNDAVSDLKEGMLVDIVDIKQYRDIEAAISDNLSDLPEAFQPFIPDDSCEGQLFELSMHRRLVLASNVVRDLSRVSELVDKESLLRATLAMWGTFIELFAESRSIQELVASAKKAAPCEERDSDFANFERFVRNVFPALFVMHEVETQLASSRLNLLVTNLSESVAPASSANYRVALLLILIAQRPKNWQSYIFNIIRSYDVLPRVVTDVVFEVLISVYIYSDEHFTVIRDVCGRIFIDRYRFESRMAADYQRSSFLLRLDNLRTKAQVANGEFST